MSYKRKKRSRLANWATLIRWKNTLIAILCVLVAFSMGESFPSAFIQIVVFVTVVCIFAAGNVLNDYLDIKTDRLAHPKRPLVTGDIPTNKALKLSIILFIIGGISALIGIQLYGYIPAIIAIAALGLLIFYDFIAKKVTLLGNFIIALLGAMVFLYAGFTQGFVLGHLYAAIFAFLFHLGREILKDIADSKADSQIGIKTLPARIGIRKSAILAIIPFITIVLISPVPYFTKYFSLWYLAVVILFVDLPLILLSMIIPHDIKPESAQKFASDLKWIMLGGLISLLLGGLTL